MVNGDNNTLTYDIASSTKDRNSFKPLAGFRKTLETSVVTKRCIPYIGGGPEDRILRGYQDCSFELTRRDFERNNFNPIVLYVDTPRQMYSFIETCKNDGQKLCDTEELPPGREYKFKYTQNWAVRLIFENDDAEDAIFQIEYSTENGEKLELGAVSFLTETVMTSFALFTASTMLMLF